MTSSLRPFTRTFGTALARTQHTVPRPLQPRRLGTRARTTARPRRPSHPRRLARHVGDDQQPGRSPHRINRPPRAGPGPVLHPTCRRPGGFDDPVGPGPEWIPRPDRSTPKPDRPDPPKAHSRAAHLHTDGTGHTLATDYPRRTTEPETLARTIPARTRSGRVPAPHHRTPREAVGAISRKGVRTSRTLRDEIGSA